MEFPYIEKHLGNTWVKKEVETLQKADWIKNPQYKSHVEIGFQVFGRIDELIGKLEHIKGFGKWALQASTSNSFKDFLLEIMVLEHLHKHADQIEIKPDRIEGIPVPEAEIVKDNDKLLVEVKRIEGIPPNIRNKVSRLFTKIREQFGDSSGIAFIGCPDFFINDHEKLIPKPEFGELIVEVERRLMNPNYDRSIKAVFLTNVDVMFNPNVNKAFVRKYFFLVRRPEDIQGISEDKIRKLIEVDGFVEVDSNFFHSGM